MPTLDEVVGNLGEPLEFAEYQVDEGYGARDGGEEIDAMSEVGQQDAEVMVGRISRPLVRQALSTIAEGLKTSRSDLARGRSAYFGVSFR